MELIREVQDLFELFKKIILAGFGAYVWYYALQKLGYETASGVIVGLFLMLVFYMMERFEEILEDNDRLRVTQLAWIAETGGEDDAESLKDE